MIYEIIIPHIEFPCKTSIGRRAVISTIVRDNFDYHMREFDARTVCLREEKLTSQWRIHVYEAMARSLESPYNFVIRGQKHKVWVLVFLVRARGTL